MVSLTHVLDVVYLLVILAVAVGGLLVVWWVSGDEGEYGDRTSEWRGALVVAAAGVFVAGLVAQFLWHVFEVSSGLFGI